MVSILVLDAYVVHELLPISIEIQGRGSSSLPAAFGFCVGGEKINQARPFVPRRRLRLCSTEGGGGPNSTTKRRGGRVFFGPGTIGRPGFAKCPCVLKGSCHDSIEIFLPGFSDIIGKSASSSNAGWPPFFGLVWGPLSLLLPPPPPLSPWGKTHPLLFPFLLHNHLPGPSSSFQYRSNKQDQEAIERSVCNETRKEMYFFGQRKGIYWIYSNDLRKTLSPQKVLNIFLPPLLDPSSPLYPAFFPSINYFHPADPSPLPPSSSTVNKPDLPNQAV